MKLTPADLRHLTRHLVYDRTALTRDDLFVFADALEIADDCARADIECCCHHHHTTVDGHHWWDTTQPQPPAKDIDEHRDTLTLSLRYLESRGLLLRDLADPHIVSFRDLQETPA